MAQFPNLSTEMTFRGKTHTNLVISEGMAPAEDMIISRTNDATTFVYEYGPEGNQTVVLAKGKIVDVVGEEYDSETGYKKTAVRQGKEASGKSIGVNLHNVYARRRDGMHSHLTKPTVITRNYIEVPLFETTDATLDNAQTLARAMKFGAAVSATGADEVKLQHGDKVVSDNDGNFRKYEEGTHSAADIVGTVWAKETNMPPAGFLQYYQEMVNPEMEAWINQMSRIPSPGIPAQGAGAYPYGAPYQHKGWLPSYEEMLGNKQMTGIPFLTDGFFRSQETLEIEVNDSNDNVEAVRTSHKDEVIYEATAGSVTVKEGVKNAAMFIKLKNKLDITKLADVKVKLDDVLVSANDLHIDVRNNTIVVYLEEPTAGDKTYNKVEIEAPSTVSAVAGLPTEWDYKGTVGAVRILLQK